MINGSKSWSYAITWIVSFPDPPDSIGLGLTQTLGAKEIFNDQ